MTSSTVSLPGGLSLRRVHAPDDAEERLELRLVERPGEEGPGDVTLLSLRLADAVALANAILELTGGRLLPFPARPAPAPEGGAA